jgi:hypothetical protein
MNIILQGGTHHGDRMTIPEDDREVMIDKWMIYRIADGEFIDSLQVFRFDEGASAERKYRLTKGTPIM